MSSHTILLVEDNEDDVFLMKRALRAAGIENPLQIAEDGQAAIDYLSGTGAYADRTLNPLPMIVFLDLKLPYKSGHEVLDWIRQQPHFETLVVIILTSSNEQVDLERAYKSGANSFVVKPPTTVLLQKLADSFKLWWLNQNQTIAITAKS
ncbi:response regulator [Rariglobus hedericola]|uniref:Response regulator n=1 Tax=Rariglobus hedericola TaxID=2597822 RepID=A0A556QKN6_9BACT|nr:response regulator [Rariglobus hedericola]TSJ77198.1 response regulator [Rariglobus hedericola]